MKTKAKHDSLFEHGGLTIDRLRALVEVADAGGIAKAVGNDPVRQSQYSRQLKELEQHFGVELTSRSHRTLTLTENGRRLAVLAREWFVGLSSFASDGRARKAIYTIGAGESLLHWVIIDALAAIGQRVPLATFTCHNRRTAAIVSSLRELSLDFGIVREDALPAGLDSRRVGFIEYRLYVPRKLLGADSNAQPHRLLTRLPIATLDAPGEYTNALEAIARRAKGVLDTCLGCTTLPQVCRAVRTGRLIAVLPIQARSELPEAEIAEFDFKALRELRRSLCLAWNPRVMRIRAGAERMSKMLADAISAQLSRV